MSFSIDVSRPLRSLGLYRSSGKHAAPRGTVHPVPRQPGSGTHRPAHAASMPRLTGSSASDEAGKNDEKAA